MSIEIGDTVVITNANDGMSWHPNSQRKLQIGDTIVVANIVDKTPWYDSKTRGSYLCKCIHYKSLSSGLSAIPMSYVELLNDPEKGCQCSTVVLWSLGCQCGRFIGD